MKTCFETNIAGYIIKIEQQRSGKELFRVIYGQSVKNGLSYKQACTEIGACILHALCCEGLASNEGV